MKISNSYASHLPILTKLVGTSDGPILELGIGIYSTPYLHWACFPEKRTLTSYESDEKYVRYFSTCRSDFHQIHHIKNWDELKIDQLWDIVLIDHNPHERRGIESKRLANNAKFIVVHDSEPEHDELYGYSKAYPSFKYRYDYKDAYPNTTVLSNFVNPDVLF